MGCPDCYPTPTNGCVDPCNQPDPCQCDSQIDASCVFYNLCGTNPNKLTCTGVQNGTSLQLVLEAFDTKLCQYVNQDYSRYNLACLRQKYTITSAQQFAESISTELCIAEQQIISNFNNLNGQILVTNQIVNGILYPKLIDPCNLGISLTDSIQTILQKILAILCNPNALPDNSPSIVAQNTNTISFVTSGIKNHTIAASVNISPTFGNIIQALGNGLYVPIPPAQIPQVLSINYSTNTISLSNGGGFIVLPAAPSPQILSLSVPSKTITISNGNTIDLTPLFAAIAVTQTPNNPQNTNSINITASGTANTTFSAVLNIDGTQPNAATVNTQGLYVPPEQVLVANDSSTIDFTTSGIDAHTLTASVKTDGTQPNALVVNANGLFVDPNGNQTPITGVDSNSIILSVSGINNHTLQANAKLDPNPLNQLLVSSNGLYVQPASGNVYTANNGLTQSITNTQLGGNLIKNTDIDFGNLYQLNFTSTPQICIGIPASMTGQYLFVNNTDPTIIIPSRVSSAVPMSNTSYFASNNFLTINGGAFTQTGNVFVGGCGGQIWFNTTGNLILDSAQDNWYSGTYGAAIKSGSSSISGNIISGGYFAIFPADSGNISSAASIRIGGANNPPSSFGSSYTGTITNFYGLKIDSISTSDYGSKIINKYAIHQTGSGDTSIFFGPVQNASATTQFTSDERVKENIVPYSRGLNELEQIEVKNFNFIYSKERTVAGVIAQQLEQIIPEAVQKGNFETPNGQEFNDFRMVDQNIIFYTMLNAIKELSEKVKTLESKLNNSN